MRVTCGAVPLPLVRRCLSQHGDCETFHLEPNAALAVQAALAGVPVNDPTRERGGLPLDVNVDPLSSLRC